MSLNDLQLLSIFIVKTTLNMTLLVSENVKGKRVKVRVNNEMDKSYERNIIKVIAKT